MSLEVVREFSDVHTLDLGGGYKVGRMSHEPSTDLQAIGQPVKEAFENFAKESGRQIHLEIEPGTFLSPTRVLCSLRFRMPPTQGQMDIISSSLTAV